MPYPYSGTLETPKSISIPTEDEAPKDHHEGIPKAREVYHAEGYIVHEVENQQDYNYFAEVTVNNSELYTFLVKLLDQGPEELSFLFTPNDSGENFWKSKSITKNKGISILDKYKRELIEDCFIEFGFLFQEGYFLEIFVSRYKYLKIWGTDSEKLREIMGKLGFEENLNLTFIDNGPHITLALNQMYLDAKFGEEILTELKEEFGN